MENIPEIEKETHRLAVVNMDWNHIKKQLHVSLEILLGSPPQLLNLDDRKNQNA
ncbi:pre-rRNA-processing protein ESF1 [Tripterygium wilfordii]|uniref:Pre-rRNA-processing protein ESF1 n=1 Tax=Tripterygium wilfordii TaxID=458696 RepID=A0A7J7E381_TRIWF|nr:pre-rRNA-processing protein ESF1 [Tripterygium wilfordii]